MKPSGRLKKTALPTIFSHKTYPRVDHDLIKDDKVKRVVTSKKVANKEVSNKSKDDSVPIVPVATRTYLTLDDDDVDQEQQVEDQEEQDWINQY